MGCQSYLEECCCWLANMGRAVFVMPFCDMTPKISLKRTKMQTLQGSWLFVSEEQPKINPKVLVVFLIFRALIEKPQKGRGSSYPKCHKR